MSLIKNVVITGATSGLGADIAAAFAKAGHKVVIGGRRGDKGAEVAARIGATYFPVDVADEASNKTFFSQAKEALGSFDYVLLNAGTEGKPGPKSAAATFESSEFDAIFGANVKGLLLGQREAVPHINQGGKIIYTSAIISLIPMGNAPVYAASKGAVDSLAMSYADQFRTNKDARMKSIGIFTINPCLYVSEMSLRLVGGQMKTLEMFSAATNPSGRPGTGEELAKSVLLIASDANPYKSGDSIVCDADQHWHKRDNEAKFKEAAQAKKDAAAAKRAAAAAAK